MEWLNNLNKAIEYIESHLDQELSYEEAARIACCSTYYFQRMFTYVAGITLADYVKKRRMTQAAFELQRTNKKVLEVAITYGYRSPTSFHRAFQSVHGITPMAAKQTGSRLTVYPPITFSVEITGGTPMPYHIEQKEAMRMVGVRVPLTMNMKKNHLVVPAFWAKTKERGLCEKLMQMSNKKPTGILGVSVYEQANRMFYYIAIATDEQVPQGMYEIEVPAATWVVFQPHGHYKESVQRVFQRFYKEWLVCSGYEYAYLPDIEVYPTKEEEGKESQVWIAIKKEENHVCNSDTTCRETI